MQTTILFFPRIRHPNEMENNTTPRRIGYVCSKGRTDGQKTALLPLLTVARHRTRRGRVPRIQALHCGRRYLQRGFDAQTVLSGARVSSRSNPDRDRLAPFSWAPPAAGALPRTPLKNLENFLSPLRCSCGAPGRAFFQPLRGPFHRPAKSAILPSPATPAKRPKKFRKG